MDANDKQQNGPEEPPTEATEEQATGSMSKYRPSPPHTPAMTLSSLERRSRLSGGSGSC